MNLAFVTEALHGEEEKTYSNVIHIRYDAATRIEGFVTVFNKKLGKMKGVSISTVVEGNLTPSS